MSLHLRIHHGCYGVCQGTVEPVPPLLPSTIPTGIRGGGNWVTVVGECVRKPWKTNQSIPAQVPDTCNCTCGPGFQPDPADPTRCIDINECSTDPCPPGERCINLVGRYMCAPICDKGYENDWIHGGACKGRSHHCEESVNFRNHVRDFNKHVLHPLLCRYT